MSAYILPVIIISLVIYACIKNVNVYNTFVFGAKSSFDLVLTSLPYIVAIFMIVEIFSVSGLSKIIATILSPAFNIFGIPSELTELILIKPFSGCGSLAVLENIFITYGADSYLARAGCAIAGASEAIFYVTAVYFVKTKVTKFRYAIPVSLIANFVGCIVACNICRIL